MYLSDKFIAATTEYSTFKSQVAAPYLTRKFTIPEQGQYTLTICGLGFYRLFINGVDITKGHLAPYIVNPDQIMLYDTYEIDKYLHVGDNVLGVLLGNGMQNAPAGAVWDMERAAFRSSPKVALCLECDGKIVFEADGNFKVHQSAIVFDDLRAGEWYDARKIIPDVWQLDFDDSLWQAAISASTPKGVKRISVAPPILPLYELKPVKIWRSGRGFVYDFGKNLAGVCRISIDGSRSQRIRIRYGEIVQNGKLRMGNLYCGPRAKRGFVQETHFIPSGNGTDVYTPSFTYFGFRYAYVQGISANQATESLLTYVVMATDMKRTGDFGCSSKKANELQQIVIDSTLSNFFHFPTDCPHREKNGWTGDAALSSEQMILNFDSVTALSQWLITICHAQREDGALPGIIPTGGWGFHWGNGPAWDTVLFTIPYNIYRYTNDRSILEYTAPYMDKYLSYMLTKIKPDGTVAYGLGDWLEAGANGANQWSTALEITDTYVAIDICDTAQKVFAVVGDTVAQKRAEEMREAFKSAFKKEFVTSDCKVGKGTQAAQAMALRAGVFTQEELPNAYLQLRESLRNEGDKMRVGIVGLKPLLDALSDGGFSELAFEMLIREDYPSMYFPVTKGANSMWEAITYIDTPLDNLSKVDSRRLISLNHQCWSCYSAWYYRRIAGLTINPDGDDAHSILFAPNCIDTLDEAHAHYDTIDGRAAISWRKDNGKVIIDCTVPTGATAKLEFNKERKDVPTGTHNYTFSLPN